jgi:hypothetical protein
MGLSARPAVSALNRLLRDEDMKVGVETALALRRIEPRHAAARDRILRTLMRYPEYGCRLGLLDKLTCEDASEFMPCLRRLLRHEDHDIYLAAARTLKRIDPKAAAKAGVP